MGGRCSQRRGRWVRNDRARGKGPGGGATLRLVSSRPRSSPRGATRCGHPPDGRRPRQPGSAPARVPSTPFPCPATFSSSRPPRSRGRHKRAGDLSIELQLSASRATDRPGTARRAPSSGVGGSARYSKSDNGRAVELSRSVVSTGKRLVLAILTLAYVRRRTFRSRAST